MSNNNVEIAPLVTGNPRRQPSHLSVSLRREVPTSTVQRSYVAGQPAVPILSPRQGAAPLDQSSDEYDGESEVANWFERANMNPRTNLGQTLQDEPPYFISPGSVQTSAHLDRYRMENRYSRLAHTSRSDSSSNGYRSIIDDLTIENRKLKEENRKLKRSRHPHLAKDRLFEITMHQMSAQDRRRLERHLLQFTSSMTESSGTEDLKTSSGSTSQESPGTEPNPKNSITSSDLNEQPSHDSAYSSMTSLLPNPKMEIAGSTPEPTRQENTKTIQNFLQNIPAPKHFAVMTERQKKKLVVQRLERLFTGKQSMQSKDLSQSQQQQEVSQSARRPEELSSPIEGAREAHMLLNPMETESRPSNLSRVPTSDIQCPNDKLQSSGNSPDSAGQRPTRPLDLDPHRTQVAVENVEYLRHLGVSTPQLVSDDSSDADSGAQGWIYLNLLINMAQLHIVNVTPDFVRQAVNEVSEKFQLSLDGDKIRWRGGSHGTELSSDSGLNTGPTQSPDDSDSICETGGKRRKMDGGRFAAIPIDTQNARVPKGTSGNVYYRPLFNHRTPSTDSLDTSSKRTSTSSSNGKYGTDYWQRHGSWSATSGSGSQNKKRRDDGTMVFYSNAQFCTDLSGDPDSVLSNRATGTEKEDCTTAQAALGCPRGWPTISRTPSGSSLSFRPFKREVPVEARHQFSSTPDLLVYSSEDDNASQELGDEWSSSYQAFESSGIGGSRPADHFALHVHTRRTRVRNSRVSKRSNFLATVAGTKKFHHRIPVSSLSAFEQPDLHEEIAKKLAFSTTLATAPPMQTPKAVLDSSVVVEYSRSEFVRLEPSPVPAALAYTLPESLDESSIGTSSIDEDESHPMNINPSTLHWTKNVSGEEDEEEKKAEMDEVTGEKSHQMDEDDEEEEDEDEYGDDDSDDESIDMLAHLRATNPEEVARREAEFDMEIDNAYEPRRPIPTVSESTENGWSAEDSSF